MKSVRKGISTNQAGPSHFMRPVTVSFRIKLLNINSHHPRVTRAWLQVSLAACAGFSLVFSTHK